MRDSKQMCGFFVLFVACLVLAAPDGVFAAEKILALDVPEAEKAEILAGTARRLLKL